MFMSVFFFFFFFFFFFSFQEGSGACQHPDLVLVPYIDLSIYRGWQEVNL